jgi:hypothetical protein
MVQGIKSNVRKGRRRRLLRCHPLEQGFVARRKSLLRAQTPHRGPLKRLPVAPASISKLSYRGRRKKPAAKVPAFPGKPERPECWFAVRPLRYSDVLGSLLRNRRRWSKKRLWRRENYLGNSNRAARNGVSGRYISARQPCSQGTACRAARHWLRRSAEPWRPLRRFPGLMRARTMPSLPPPQKEMPAGISHRQEWCGEGSGKRQGSATYSQSIIRALRPVAPVEAWRAT